MKTPEQPVVSDSERDSAATGVSKSPIELFKARHWARYAAPMAECERRLALATAEPGGKIGEACSLTLEAGGKRLRPLLVFLAAQFGETIGEDLYSAAAAVELVHMATLVHDDILDGAELRRGRPTLAAKYGSLMSMAAGDYLFSSAFGILTGARSTRAISMLSRASLDLSLGELAQRQQTGDFSLTTAGYMERCRLKTSSLFSVACMMGALLSGCSQETVKAMEEFGLRLGLAFQIADDILDFSGESAELGKRVGTDLRDGTVTLPLLIALARDATLIERLGGELTDSGIDSICRKVQATGALDEAVRQAREQVSRAIEALEVASSELDIAPLALVAEMAADRKK